MPFTYTGTVNGSVGMSTVDLIDAKITLSIQGCWVADVIASNQPLGEPVGPTVIIGPGKVTITLGDIRFLGTVLRWNVYRGSVYARIVGGAGGLGNIVAKPGAQNASTVGNFLSAFLGAFGEQLAPVTTGAPSAIRIDVSYMNLTTSWAPITGYVSSNLTSLVQSLPSIISKALGTTAFEPPQILASELFHWRVLPSGRIWFGYDPANTLDATAHGLRPYVPDGTNDLLDYHPEQGIIEVGIATPALLPGMFLSWTENGIKGICQRVEYHFDSEKLRMKAVLSSEASNLNVRGGKVSFTPNTGDGGAWGDFPEGQ